MLVEHRSPTGLGYFYDKNDTFHVWNRDASPQHALYIPPVGHYLLRSCFHIPGIPILRLPNACPSRLCSWPGDAIDMGGVGYAHRLVAVSNEAKNQEELSVLGDAQLPLWPNSASVACTAFSRRRCVDATRQ